MPNHLVTRAATEQPMLSTVVDLVGVRLEAVPCAPALHARASGLSRLCHAILHLRARLTVHCRCARARRNSSAFVPELRRPRHGPALARVLHFKPLSTTPSWACAEEEQEKLPPRRSDVEYTLNDPMHGACVPCLRHVSTPHHASRSVPDAPDDPTLLASMLTCMLVILQ